MFASDRADLGVWVGVFLGWDVRRYPQMALSDAAIRAAKPAAKAYKLFDGGGLFLLVNPSGGKLWRLKYRHLGKEQALALGRYPDVGLKDARERREEARKMIAAGLNPSFEKKRAAIAASVGAAILSPPASYCLRPPEQSSLRLMVPVFLRR